MFLVLTRFDETDDVLDFMGLSIHDTLSNAKAEAERAAKHMLDINPTHRRVVVDILEFNATNPLYRISLVRKENVYTAQPATS